MFRTQMYGELDFPYQVSVEVSDVPHADVWFLHGTHPILFRGVLLVPMHPLVDEFYAKRTQMGLHMVVGW
jgi:hypothetical protein